MREFIANPAFARKPQIALIFAYVLLAILCSLHRKTWPVAFYYVACFVKDTGVEGANRALYSFGQQGSTHLVR